MSSKSNRRGRDLAWRAAAVMLYFAVGSVSGVEQRPEKSSLPVYELKMTAKDLLELERTAYSNQTHPGTFSANGQAYQVKVRYRGQWARTWPKRALKIFFEEDKPFEGQHCLNLNSSWRDPAFIREHLAYLTYAACGVPAPKSRMVRLDLNGKFRGLYVEVEQPEKTFLRRLDLKGAGVFKAISESNQADERDLRSLTAYARHYKREQHKELGLGELQGFCQELARATNVLEFFTRRVNLDEYVNYLAATALVQHWDCFNKNHFLLLDLRTSQKWSVIPWDLDRTFGDHWRGGFDHAELPLLLGTRELPGTTGWNRLEDRFFSQTALKARFAARLAELLDKEFTPEKLFPLLDQLESQIATEAAMDRRLWPSGPIDLHSGITQVKSYIQRRRVFLRRELARLRQTRFPAPNAN